MLLHIEISSSEILPPRSFYRNTFFSQEKKKKKKKRKNDSARENSYELSVLRNSRIDEVSMLETLESSIFEIFKFPSSPTIDFSNLLTLRLSNYPISPTFYSQIAKLSNLFIRKFPNFQALGRC